MSPKLEIWAMSTFKGMTKREIEKEPKKLQRKKDHGASEAEERGYFIKEKRADCAECCLEWNTDRKRVYSIKYEQLSVHWWHNGILDLEVTLEWAERRLGG